MKLSKFIDKLQAMLEENGDMDIRYYNYNALDYTEPKLGLAEVKPHIDYLGEGEDAAILCPPEQEWLEEKDQEQFNTQDTLMIAWVG